MAALLASACGGGLESTQTSVLCCLCPGTLPWRGILSAMEARPGGDRGELCLDLAAGEMAPLVRILRLDTDDLELRLSRDDRSEAGGGPSPSVPLSELGAGPGACL